MNSIQQYLQERDKEFIEIFTNYGNGYHLDDTVDPKEVLNFNNETLRTVLRMVRGRMGKKPTTSNYSTADLIQTSSTGLEMERNKGFNNAIDVLDQLLTPLEEELSKGNI